MRCVVVALCGLPGSGKSTLARALAAATGWMRLDRDELRRRVFADGGGYSDADKRALAAWLCDELAAHAANAESVIVDGMTFSRMEERERFASAAHAAGARWRLVWLDCDAALARERVRDDEHHPATDRTASLVDRVAARFERPVHAIRIDATQPTDAQLGHIIAALGILAGERNET